MPVYAAPPVTHNTDGEERTVGLELEFAGLDTAEILDNLKRVLGGRLVQQSALTGELQNTRFGTFRVEMDATLLTERTYVEALKQFGIDIEGDPKLEKAEALVVRAAREIVPMEVVTPPIAWSKLGELEPVWRQLRTAGARGTRAALRFAFGMHINADLPAYTAECTVSHLKAFLLLQPWLVNEGKTDLSRRVTPYINPFPKEYRSHVLALDYHPDWHSLIADYLLHNPTRDRPLDLLPVFATLDEKRIWESVKDAKLVKGRRAFHYRLPNCQIDEPDWSPAWAFNRWLVVERVAADSELLSWLLQRFVERESHFSLADPWPEEINDLICSTPQLKNLVLETGAHEC